MGMISRAEDFMIRKSDSTFLIALFLFIYFTSQIIIGSILHEIGTLNVLALQTTFSRDMFLSIAASWMASGEIEMYYKHFYFDYLHPLWYSILLSLLIARGFTLNHVNPKFNFMVLTPFMAGLCDLVENSMHVYMLADLDRATHSLVWFSGLAANTKWFLAFLGLGTSVFLIGLWLVKRYILKRNA
ncbi:MAG: hypothetical protein QMD11_00545 [Smithella sp.]|nr:hypothetical protein [Smithella sp.]